MAATFDFKGKLLIIRLNRLSHIPPAKHGTEILLERRVPLVVFEYAGDYLTESTLQDGIPTVRLSTAWVKWFPAFLRAGFSFIHCLLTLGRRILRERPRFIFTHGLQEQWIAYFINRLFGIPYACHLHEVYEPADLQRLNRLFLKGEGITLRRAAFTVFSSEDRSQIYRKRYGLKAESLIVYNSPRLRTARSSPDFYRKHGISQGKKVLLYIGGIGPLNASAEVLESVPYLSDEFVLVFAGWGESSYVADLKKRTNELGISERVKFMGPVSNKWEWIDNADGGFCIYKGYELRSRYNAGPSNKLFEFISAGKPVIANRAEDFVRIVEGHQLGINVDPLNPKEMARSIEALFKDELRLKRINKNALSLHLNEYNYEAQFDSVLARLLVDVITTEKIRAA